MVREMENMVSEARLMRQRTWTQRLRRHVFASSIGVRKFLTLLPSDLIVVSAFESTKVSAQSVDTPYSHSEPSRVTDRYCIVGWETITI